MANNIKSIIPNNYTTISKKTLERLTNSLKENLSLFNPTNSSTEISESKNNNPIINQKNDNIDKIFNSISQATNKYESNWFKAFFVRIFHSLFKIPRKIDRLKLTYEIKTQFLENMLVFSNKTDDQTYNLVDLVDIKINKLVFKITINKTPENLYQLSFKINDDNNDQDNQITQQITTDELNNFTAEIAYQFYKGKKYNKDLLLYYLKNKNSENSKNIIKEIRINDFNDMNIISLIEDKPDLIKSTFENHNHNQITDIEKLATQVLQDNNNKYKNNDIIIKALKVVIDKSQDKKNTLNVEYVKDKIIKLAEDTNTEYAINLFSDIPDDIKINYASKLLNIISIDNNETSIGKIITYVIDNKKSFDENIQKKCIKILNNNFNINDNNYKKQVNTIINDLDWDPSELKQIQLYLSNNSDNLNIPQIFKNINSSDFNPDNYSLSTHYPKNELFEEIMCEFKIYLTYIITSEPTQLDANLFNKFNTYIDYWNQSVINDQYKKEAFELILKNKLILENKQGIDLNTVYKYFILKINKQENNQIEALINNEIAAHVKEKINSNLKLDSIKEINQNWHYFEYCIKNKIQLENIDIESIKSQYEAYVENPNNQNDLNLKVYIDTYNSRIELLQATTTKTTTTTN